MTSILVVDDTATQSFLAGKLLVNAGVGSVRFAANGKEALELLRSAPADLVVTDLHMPELNGLELVAAMGKEFPRVPVILMTANGSEEIAVRALECGAASYVPKRHLAHELARTAVRVLGAAGARRDRLEVLQSLERQELAFVLANNFSIPALCSYLLEAVIGLWGPETLTAIRTQVALEESLTNAVYHGNLELHSSLRDTGIDDFWRAAEARMSQSPYRERRLRVHCRLDASRAVFTVGDEGPGFAPGERTAPADASNLEGLSDRGIRLMRAFMDEVRFNSTGNEVTLVKNRAS